MIQKSHIWNSFFENIILLIRRFYNCSDVPVDIIRVFFNFSFSNRKPQSQQKLAKKDHTFYNTVLLKKLTNLNSLDIENDTVCSLNVAKNLSDFTNFQQTCFFLVSEKNICTAPFLDAQELHFESKCLYISLYLLKKIFVPET